MPLLPKVLTAPARDRDLRPRYPPWDADPDQNTRSRALRAKEDAALLTMLLRKWKRIPIRASGVAEMCRIRGCWIRPVEG